MFYSEVGNKTALRMWAYVQKYGITMTSLASLFGGIDILLSLFGGDDILSSVQILSCNFERY